MKQKYITKLEQIPGIPPQVRKDLQKVSQHFAFRSNEYYLSLINWDDPHDPIRRIVIPDPGELEEWGRLDASNEYRYTVVPGFQHKYSPTAVVLVTDVCAGFCRFCFRKRLFMNIEEEVVRDISDGLEYIHQHTEITNVLLTGGDPLVMSTAKLRKLIEQVRQIPHVRIIRLGTKMPAYNPYRITDDPSLLDLISECIPGRKIYIMAQFNHPRELTDVATEAMLMMQKAGARTFNQTPLIRGVNDDPAVLSELFKELSFHGITPYYVFQCRPTLGNKIYAVPVEESYMIFQHARRGCSGLAKSARFVMSHVSGKIEIIGKTENEIYFRYHQPANPDDHGRMMVFKSNPQAYWFDDYTKEVPEQVTEDYYDD
jgi:lysine 2,3-aminomutase